MNNNLKVVMAIVEDMREAVRRGRWTKDEINKRFRWTIKELVQMTGLSQQQVIQAVTELLEKDYLKVHYGTWVKFSLTEKCKEHIKQLSKRGIN